MERWPYQSFRKYGGLNYGKFNVLFNSKNVKYRLSFK